MNAGNVGWVAQRVKGIQYEEGFEEEFVRAAVRVSWEGRYDAPGCVAKVVKRVGTGGKGKAPGNQEVRASKSGREGLQ